MKFLITGVFVIAGVALFAQQPTANPLDLVNTVYDEQRPVISPDGLTLFFTVGNHPQNIGAEKDPGDIWFSRWVGDRWSAPIHAGSVLNDRAYNSVAGISADGNQLFLMGHYDPSGASARTQGISLSRKTGNGWSSPENISIPYFRNTSGLSGGFVSPDKAVLVFSAETYGTYGVEDVYVSLNEDGRWTEPKNVGVKINTRFQELSPSLSADTKTLYFSSNGRRGNGSFDVFYATRLDDTWTNWSEPVNMGSRINTSGRELSYCTFPAQGFALYSSNTNSDGYGDIRIHKPDPLIDSLLRKDSAVASIKIVEITREETGDDDKEVRVYGSVKNAKTGEGIEATAVFSSAAQNRPMTVLASTGYSVVIPSTDAYTIRVEAKGYISVIEKLDIHTYEMKELEMNFSLQPVAIGTTVNLKNVLFERGSATLLPQSNDELDLVAAFMDNNPKVVIELAGHTDNRGVHSHNVRLSQQRVNTVKAYLVSKGISARRVSGKGYGGLKPIASNDSEESRMLNRRVEFTIKKF